MSRDTLERYEERMAENSDKIVHAFKRIAEANNRIAARLTWIGMLLSALLITLWFHKKQ